MSDKTQNLITIDPKRARKDAARLRPSRGTRSDRVIGTTSHIILAIWSIVVILPLLWTLFSSFKTTGEIFDSPFTLPSSWEPTNYVNAWTKYNFGQMFLNTVIVVIYYLMLAGLTFPVFLAIVPLFFILQGIGLLGTLPGLIITYVAFALPFTVFFLYSFFKSLPYEIQEAAYVDGASEWRTFFQVMLPMAKPGLAAVGILNFLGLWNQFLLFAAVIITIVPVLIVYIFFQRQLQGSVSQGTSR